MKIKLAVTSLLLAFATLACNSKSGAEQAASGVCANADRWKGGAAKIRENCDLCCRVELGKKDYNKGTGSVDGSRCTCHAE